MLYLSLLILAVLGYLVSASLIAKTINAGNSDTRDINNQDTSLDKVFVVACSAVIAHFLYAVNISIFDGHINFSLSSMACLISLILVIVFLLGSLAMPIRKLGILVFPLTAISLAFSYLWGSGVSSSNLNLNSQSTAFVTHILISILAYCLISIAAVQALLYVYQERLLKSRAASTMLLTLPPLQTMEQLLFRLVVVGFILLSLTLFSGVLFSQEIFGQPFALKHHTIFAVLSWIVFATLLFKRCKSGLRGSQAVVWTLIGFILMQIGYFGTKIVTESLNIQ